VENHNVQIETRWAALDAGMMRRFAKELVSLQPDLVLSPVTPTTAALMQQTRTVPIIFVLIADPVGSGLVASLAHPGGNVTGFIQIEASVAGKWLELLKEIAPRVARVAFLFNPVTARYAEYYLSPFKAAAASIRVGAISAPVRDNSELESVIVEQAREPNSGSRAIEHVRAFPDEPVDLGRLAHAYRNACVNQNKVPNHLLVNEPSLSTQGIGGSCGR
jgi:putative ABC transport system substrate-binding protein